MSDVSTNIFRPALGPLSGIVQVPGDKSLTQRALLLAAISTRPVTISDPLIALDTESTIEVIERLGCNVIRDEGSVNVEGVGLQGARPGVDLDVGNSGTLIRLISGWLCGQPYGSWTIKGDESIARRPMGRIVEPLLQMGAQITASNGNYAPLTVDGSQIVGTTIVSQLASAQVKSAVLLAALNANGPTTYHEPFQSRDHSERMLKAAGVPITRSRGEDSVAITVGPVDHFELSDQVIPGDPSSAAFIATAAAIIPGSRVVLPNVSTNSTRVAFFEILRRMGADISWQSEDESEQISSIEPRGTITVVSNELTATTISAAEVPNAIDELPLIALLGCFANGETRLSGAADLRNKESDRIEAVVDGLRGLDVDIEAHHDGFTIRGAGVIKGGMIDSRGDHRIAMLGAVAGLASLEGVEIMGFDASAVSYPQFSSVLQRL